MRFDNPRWRGPRPDDLEHVRQLMEIYRNLLLQTGGDVDEALRWMEHFGREYGFFGEKFGIEDFKKLLEESGEAAKTPQGFEMTPRGDAASGRTRSTRSSRRCARVPRATTARRSRARAASGCPKRGAGSSATTSRTSTRSPR
jgi:hypothetical protein